MVDRNGIDSYSGREKPPILKFLVGFSLRILVKDKRFAALCLKESLVGGDSKVTPAPPFERISGWGADYSTLPSLKESEVERGRKDKR